MALQWPRNSNNSDNVALLAQGKVPHWESMSGLVEEVRETTPQDLLTDVAKLRSEVASLRLEREQDMDEIRAACALADFVLWTCRSVDHQKVAGHGPAGSYEQLGSVEVVVGGVKEGQKPLHGDALN